MIHLVTAGANSPAKTHFQGLGLDLHFQDGPIPTYGVNGTTNEEVLQVVRERLDSLNALFPCHENEQALNHIRFAIEWLEARTRERQARGVEGKTKP